MEEQIRQIFKECTYAWDGVDTEEAIGKLVEFFDSQGYTKGYLDGYIDGTKGAVNKSNFKY